MNNARISELAKSPRTEDALRAAVFERLDPAPAETGSPLSWRASATRWRATTRSWSSWTRVAGAARARTSALRVRALNEMSRYFPAWRE